MREFEDWLERYIAKYGVPNGFSKNSILAREKGVYKQWFTRMAYDLWIAKKSEFDVAENKAWIRSASSALLRSRINEDDYN